MRPPPEELRARWPCPGRVGGERVSCASGGARQDKRKPEKAFFHGNAERLQRRVEPGEVAGLGKCSGV